MGLINFIYIRSKYTLFSILISLAVTALYAPYVSAYRLTARELPTQRLLPVSPIHRLIQDSDGFMWYATEGGGLCRDDGYNIVVFRSPFPQFSSTFQVIGVDSMVNNHITCLAEGKIKKHIWFGTNQGLYHIDKSDYKIHTSDNPLLKSNIINLVFASDDGYIWVNVPNFILRLDSEGSLVNQFSTTLNGRARNILGFYQDKRHNLYILCSDNTILLYDPSTQQMKETNWNFGSDPSAMTEDTRNNAFYVGTWGGGVAYYDPAGSGVLQCNYPIPKNEFGKLVLDVLYDNIHRILWVVTMDDLYAYQADREHLQPISLDKVLPNEHKVLDKIFHDKDGNIWVPGYTPHTFIISLDNDNMMRYPVDVTRRTTGFPVMADVVENDGDYYWIWLGRDNIALYHPATDRIAYGTQNNLVIAKCIEKCADMKGIWGASGNEILHITHSDMSIISKSIGKVPDDIITTLHEANNSLWIGTEKAIYEIPVTGGAARKICDSAGWSHKIAVSARNDVYVATGEGLIHINADGNKEWLLKDMDCSDITIAPDGKLWTATSQGSVFSYEPRYKKLENENESCLLGGESIKNIEADDSGHIWILTDQYVKEFNPSNHAIRVFHSIDDNIGMVYMHSVRKTTGNRVCIGGMGAFCVVPSSHELDNMPAAPEKPYITSVTSGNRYILTGTQSQTVGLNPDDGDCNVTFSTLDHLHASQISYAYRLDGLQSEWTYLPPGCNTAFLGRLPKGSYRLLVKATNRYGNWSETNQTITLRRLPHWYESWWAYLLYFMLSIAIVYGTVWVYRRFQQILELHRRRNEVALGSINISIDEKDMPDFDKQFLEKAVALVESNISDPKYNVERLSEDICMSRMSLYRKIHEQTGHTPSEFIRDIRLKRAAALLSTSDIPVKEVAACVGFATPSNFSKCFKEMFGILPAQFQNENLKKDKRQIRDL